MTDDKYLAKKKKDISKFQYRKLGEHENLIYNDNMYIRQASVDSVVG